MLLLKTIVISYEYIEVVTVDWQLGSCYPSLLFLLSAGAAAVMFKPDDQRIGEHIWIVFPFLAWSIVPPYAIFFSRPQGRRWACMSVLFSMGEHARSLSLGPFLNPLIYFMIVHKGLVDLIKDPNLIWVHLAKIFLLVRRTLSSDICNDAMCG